MQIGILADLNCCDRGEIERILTEGGESLPTKKKAESKPMRKPQRGRKKPEAAEEEPPEKIEMLFSFLDALDEDIKTLEKELRRKEEQYKMIVEYITKGGIS